MQDFSSTSDHFIAYMEQWLHPDIWHRVVKSDVDYLIEIDQRRGKDGLISKLSKGIEDHHILLIDLNGVTTIRDFIERFLTAFMQNKVVGIDVVSKILVEAFADFNPTVGLNPYTEQAAIFFPQQETDVKRLGKSFIDSLAIINHFWEKPVIYVFDNASQLTVFDDDYTKSFIKDTIVVLKEKNRLIYLIEDSEYFTDLKAMTGVSKKDLITSPPPEADTLLGYFARFWELEVDSIAYKNMKSILSLISHDPILAWNISNRIYLHGSGKRITHEQLKQQLDILLTMNNELYRNIYNALTNYQKRLLKAVAITNGKKITTKDVRHKFELNTSPYVIQGLTFLRKKRLLRKYGAEHHFTDPLLRVWILKYF